MYNNDLNLKKYVEKMKDSRTECFYHQLFISGHSN